METSFLLVGGWLNQVEIKLISAKAEASLSLAISPATVPYVQIFSAIVTVRSSFAYHKPCKFIGMGDDFLFFIFCSYTF